MSKSPSEALADPNDTGTGDHVPSYPREQLDHLQLLDRMFAEHARLVESPYSEPSQADDVYFSPPGQYTLHSRNLNRFPDYKELQKPHWIRVLKVEPGIIYTDIQCSLIHVNLDDPRRREYEAISYTWGAYYEDPSLEDPQLFFWKAPTGVRAQTTVFCGGVPVKVTTSLFHALQLYRRMAAPRYLWADALCINQSDALERDYQVSLMQFIYQKAREVLVWVGWRDTYTIDNAMYLVSWLVNQEHADVVRATAVERAVWYKDGLPVEKTHIRARTPSTSSQYSSDYEPNDPAKEEVAFEPTSLKPLVALFEARYFSRLWVFQELALSPLATIFWGRAKMRFEWVALVADLIERKHMAEFASYDTALVGLQNCAKMYNTWKGAYANDSFFDLLLATRGLRSQEPVDKVYGLLGIRTRDSAPADGKRFVEVDYNKGKYEVFRSVAEKVLLDGQDVRCLAAVERRDGQWDNGEASWVPDFTVLGDIFLPALDAHTHGETSAGVLRSTDCAISSCLTLQGTNVDTIAMVIDPGFDPTSHWRNIASLNTLRALVNSLLSLASDETLAICLTAGFALSMTNAVDDIPAHVAALHAFVAWQPTLTTEVDDSASCLVSPPSDTSDSEAQIAYRFFQASARAMHSRHAFCTVEGLLGVGPRGVAEGDAVVVLFGGNVPFVLRGLGDVAGHWRLVGQSYVCGLMEGEGIVKWKASGDVAEGFHIF